ncbi:hypothetical protein HZC09_05865 [Candidatus Micrarchaeota archaeon]|nr:hypothetical protein [Candidatus Micrarchaeota archaeon]
MTVKEAANFYLKTGETADIDAIDLGAVTYHIVKINNNPTVVLTADDGGYMPVKDDAKLNEVLGEYAKKAYNAIDWKKSMAILAASKNITKEVIGDCVQGTSTFLINIPRRVIRLGNTNLRLFYLIERSQNNTYKLEYDAIAKLNGSAASFNTSYKGFIENAEIIESAVASSDSPKAMGSLGILLQSTDTLKKDYTTVTSAYASLAASIDFSSILKYTFYDQGTAHTCAFNGNATTALTNIETEFKGKGLNTMESMKSRITTETATRETAALGKTEHALRSESFTKLENKITNTTGLYAGTEYTPSFSDLNKKKASLEAILEKMKNSTTSQASEYDALEKTVKNNLEKYAQYVTEFKDAAESIDATKKNLTAAVKRYGEADDRLKTLDDELNGVKKLMSTNILALEGGDFNNVNFANVSKASTELKEKIAGMKAKESEIDPVIIGAVVVLLLGLGGTVFYFRKMKEKKTEGLGDK